MANNRGGFRSMDKGRPPNRTRGGFRGGGTLRRADGTLPALGTLDEWGGDARRYQSEPTAFDLTRSYSKQPMQPGKRPADGGILPGDPGAPLGQRIDERNLPVVRTIPATIGRIERRYMTVGNAVPLRVDAGIKSRMKIMIVNLSVNILWVDFAQQSCRANVCVPLPAATGVATFDGGVLTEDANEDVEWWIIAGAGLANALIVVESARFRK